VGANKLLLSFLVRLNLARARARGQEAPREWSPSRNAERPRKKLAIVALLFPTQCRETRRDGTGRDETRRSENWALVRGERV